MGSNGSTSALFLRFGSATVAFEGSTMPTGSICSSGGIAFLLTFLPTGRRGSAGSKDSKSSGADDNSESDGESTIGFCILGLSRERGFSK